MQCSKKYIYIYLIAAVLPDVTYHVRCRTVALELLPYSSSETAICGSNIAQ